MESKTTDVLVVGAGVAGLVAACTLQSAGHDVIVVDKGRSVGGRLATRRIGGGVADHGAQYFTARSNEFQAQIDRWIKEGLVYLWAMGFSTGSLTGNEANGHPRYAVHGGMNRLAKHLAAGLNVDVDTKIQRVERQGARWLVSAENGERYEANALLLTPPVPQSLALLDAGQIALADEDRHALESITYSPCIAAMFRFTGDVKLPVPGGVQRPAHTIPWIADNQQKGISDERILTLHADPDYSRRYWDAPEVEIVETMQAYLQPYLKSDARLVEAQIKRWRYSFPETLYAKPVLLAAALPVLAFAGDAFGGPRVEGAYLSGLAAGRTILEALS
ncbi:MAG: FAD-dependent oxidoreductase [Caldilineaceae bacterium]|nr:FAD-dependent oxidoreductase [Caldilineaceae bacterium]